MLEVYCGGLVPTTLYSRLALCKAMSNLHWVRYGLVQHANGNPAEDLWVYVLGRLERCKKQVGNAELGRHLGVARGS